MGGFSCGVCGGVCGVGVLCGQRGEVFAFVGFLWLVSGPVVRLLLASGVGGVCGAGGCGEGVLVAAGVGVCGSVCGGDCGGVAGDAVRLQCRALLISR
mmetsp:Transcript_111206/g.203759  ORF Transcript_111206/g.203759 Transcript_111206/m.203759 type:complete len:98 (-) Transcript_111206:124-417(-)